MTPASPAVALEALEEMVLAVVDTAVEEAVEAAVDVAAAVATEVAIDAEMVAETAVPAIATVASLALFAASTVGASSPSLSTSFNLYAVAEQQAGPLHVVLPGELYPNGLPVDFLLALVSQMHCPGRIAFVVVDVTAAGLIGIWPAATASAVAWSTSTPWPVAGSMTCLPVAGSMSGTTPVVV